MEIDKQSRTPATQGTTQITLPPSLQIYSPAVINRTFDGVRTVDDVLNINLPCLRQLAKQDGVNQNMVVTLLKIHLVALDAFLKQKNGLSQDEVELIAEEVMQKYGGMLNFADIHVIFRNAKLGRYGELFNQLSCAKVMKWFDDYSDERCNKAYQKNLNADKAMYGVSGGKDRKQVLESLGYKICEDGAIVVDNKKVALMNSKRQPQPQPKKDDEYEKIKVQVKIKSILAKNPNERSEEEKLYLLIHKTNNNE